MCILEEKLHTVHDDAKDIIYPAYLVLTTSIAGIAMTKRCVHQKLASWYKLLAICRCLPASKALYEYQDCQFSC